MPYISVRVSQSIPEEKKSLMHRGVADIIVDTIPGKALEYCMVDLQGDCCITLGGGAHSGAFVDLRLLGPSPAEAKKAFIKKLSDYLQAQLGTPAGQVYFNFVELQEWGSGDSYLSV